MAWAAVLSIAFLLVPSSGALAAGSVETPFRDAVAYTADLTTTGDGRTWTGTETILLRNAARSSLSRVWLRLWGNGPQGCRPRAVVVTSIEGGRAGQLRQACSALEVILPRRLARGDQTTLTLSLSITAPLIQDRFGNAEGLWLFGNALPVVAQRDVTGWRLPGYSAYGESFVSSWAKFSLALRHPADLEVAASGTTTTTPEPGGATALTTSAIDARDTFWAAGQMGEETRTTRRGTVVRAWAPLGAAADRSDAADQSRGALEEIERHLPEYPYDEFDVIVARIEAGGGMEYPSLVLTDASSEVTRHEVGHQWFYGLVGNDQYQEPWVDEGLTSFVEYSWSTKAELPRPSCYPATRLAVTDPTTFVTGSMKYWNRHVGQYSFAYNNPVCALREIRAKMGRRAFDRTMRRVVTDHATGFLSAESLRRSFRKAGGRAIDRIWSRWGLAPGRA